MLLIVDTSNNNIFIRAIIKASWLSFACILQVTGVEILQVADSYKRLPHEVARDCGSSQSFNTIVNAF